MVRVSSEVEYRFVVPGQGVSFRSPRAKIYKAAVVRAARPGLPTQPRAEPVEIRLDYFHVTPRRFDMDNIAKCVIDALNGIAYIDDQLARLQSARAHDISKRVTINGGPVDLIKPLRRYRDYLFVRVRVIG